MLARPMRSFFIALGLLLLLIIAGSILSNLGKEKTTRQEIVKDVRVLPVGNAATVTLQARIQKEGVIAITAQAPGIVDEIHVNEGESVSPGKWLISLASNYTGGNAPGLQAELARVQYQNVNDTYQTQKDLITTQRSLAEANRDNAEQLRLIADRSIGDTQEILRFNESMLTLVNQAIGNTPSDPQADQFANPLQQTRGQLLGTVVQIRAQLRNLEQQADTTRAPYELASLQKDATFKQLEVQEKALDMSREVSRIQYNLALVNASLMHPAAPCNAIVERIHVVFGQNITPGAPLATVRCSEVSTSALALVPYDIATSLDKTTQSTLLINRKRIPVTPAYVSEVATDGQMYTALYKLPEIVTKTTTNAQYVSIEIPLRDRSTADSIMVPIDAVYQSQSQASIFVVSNQKVVAKKVTLGNVYGKYVQVLSGISPQEQIIVNRNVVEGEKVRISNE